MDKRENYKAGRGTFFWALGAALVREKVGSYSRVTVNWGRALLSWRADAHSWLSVGRCLPVLV